MKKTKPSIDLDAIGYPAALAALETATESAFGQLTKAEIQRACDALDIEGFDAMTASHMNMLADTAIFFSAGKGRKRAIDRIAAKTRTSRDPLIAYIGTCMPNAVFSIFALRGVDKDGCVIGEDVLDRGRPLRIMDVSLAEKIEEHGETLVAGRFFDFGPWHMGFGLVFPLRKSQVTAIGLTLSLTRDVLAAREHINTLIFVSQIHDVDLVQLAVEPLIAELADAIDNDELDPASLVAVVEALTPDDVPEKRKPNRKRRGP